jgi:hypothetical protein
VNQVLIERYRCPEQFVRIGPSGPLAAEEGYFRFGPDVIGYGRTTAPNPESRGVNGCVTDFAGAVEFSNSELRLPFDLTDVIENLRRERYASARSAGMRTGHPDSPFAALYFLLRPLLPMAARIRLQRLFFQNWRRIPFPAWPVDATVDQLLETALVLSMKAQGLESVPFIWFWPDNASGAAIVTHDVETARGVGFCGRVMDIDDAYGIRSAFQIVPEKRYRLPNGFLDQIRRRGHEVNVQDLNHDGRLFSDRNEFQRRVRLINAYGREFGAEGFRAAVLFRNPDWHHSLEFAYDMSIPSVAHLEPQRGGCCTVFPFFIGNVLELPVTTTQDYSLFHVLGDYSLGVWRTQTERIMEKHGLASFIAHPDYLIPRRAREAYRGLLEYLSGLRAERALWIARPNEINQWWRQRSRMKLVARNGRYEIEGEGKERAQIAHATVAGDRLVYVRGKAARAGSA